ncbi:MAG: hypothetical protein H8E12_12235 [Rhodobacteraceae bacterium]|nr:hypothetical protein [Paracoccaceae bacterium]
MINLRYFPVFIYLLLLMAGCGSGSGNTNPNSSESLNSNNPPSLTVNQDYNVPENSSLVGEVAYSDLDGDEVNLSVEGIDSESFYIDETSQLRFNFSPDYENAKDSNGDNYFEIEIVASDGEDNDSISILVAIINLRENKFDELAIENLKME